jgi:hypothetical protein
MLPSQHLTRCVRAHGKTSGLPVPFLATTAAAADGIDELAPLAPVAPALAACCAFCMHMGGCHASSPVHTTANRNQVAYLGFCPLFVAV